MVKRFQRIIVLSALVSFLSSSIQMPVYAQIDPMPFMPAPGTMVHLSPQFTPAYLKGIVIHPNDPLKFDFIIYKGDNPLSDAQKREEYTKLTKYFLASLAIPDDDQWVNLSPYEKDRIIKDDFGKTAMGRDLLAQDYLLKQITASLIYPESQIGKEFWKKVYAQAQKQYGTTDIPVNTFNKVWILPDDALIYEKGNNAPSSPLTAYVLKNHLRVMLEEDYLSLQKHSAITHMSFPNAFVGDPGLQGSGFPTKAFGNDKVHTIASQIIRQTVLPELQKEVNEDANFAPLRQVYSGMLLAAWFKRTLKQSLLGQIYINQAKTKGVEYTSPIIPAPDKSIRGQAPAGIQGNDIEAIYQRYLKAYKKGVFDFIKEDTSRMTNETMPRKYFSGGMDDFAMASNVLHRKIIKEELAPTLRDMGQMAEEMKDVDLAQMIMTEDREIQAEPEFQGRIDAAGPKAGIDRAMKVSELFDAVKKDWEALLTGPRPNHQEEEALADLIKLRMPDKGRWLNPLEDFAAKYSHIPDIKRILDNYNPKNVLEFEGGEVVGVVPLTDFVIKMKSQYPDQMQAILSGKIKLGLKKNEEPFFEDIQSIPLAWHRPLKIILQQAKTEPQSQDILKALDIISHKSGNGSVLKPKLRGKYVIYANPGDARLYFYERFEIVGEIAGNLNVLGVFERNVWRLINSAMTANRDKAGINVVMQADAAMAEGAKSILDRPAEEFFVEQGIKTRNYNELKRAGFFDGHPTLVQFIQNPANRIGNRTGNVSLAKNLNKMLESYDLELGMSKADARDILKSRNGPLLHRPVRTALKTIFKKDLRLDAVYKFLRKGWLNKPFIDLITDRRVESLMRSSGVGAVGLRAFNGMLAKEFHLKLRMTRRQAIQAVAGNFLIGVLVSGPGFIEPRQPNTDILLLGNDNLDTFRLTLKLYAAHMGQRIVIAGGRGRLTPPLISNARAAGFQIENENFSEARIIQEIMEQMIQKEDEFQKLLREGALPPKINFELEEKSTNTFENLENYKAMLPPGEKRNVILIQTPHQQLRAMGAFHAVFKDERTVHLFSRTIPYDKTNKTAYEMAADLIGEAWRLVIYSLAGTVNLEAQFPPAGLDGIPDLFWSSAVELLDTLPTDQRAKLAGPLWDLTKGHNVRYASLKPSIGAFTDKIKDAAMRNRNGERDLGEFMRNLGPDRHLGAQDGLGSADNGRSLVKSGTANPSPQDIGNLLEGQFGTQLEAWRLNKELFMAAMKDILKKDVAMKADRRMNESNSPFNERENDIFTHLHDLQYKTHIVVPGSIRAFNLLKSDNDDIPPSELRVAQDEELGYVVVAGVGQFILWELDSNQRGSIYSSNHVSCAGLAIRARKGNKLVIGHAHIQPTTGTSMMIQLEKVLSYLTNPRTGLSDIELMLTTDAESLFGLPSFTEIESLAKGMGISIRNIPRRSFDIGDVLTTANNAIFRIRTTWQTKQIINEEWNRLTQNKAQIAATDKGGIDLNSDNLNLRIKRDGSGVLLPLAQQDLAQLADIQGLDPVILSIKPASQTALFAELTAHP